MWCNSVQICNPTPVTHTSVCSNLSLMTSMQLPPHQIISYICHPTDVRAPAASYILFMTILIICLCADLSVTVAPLLYNVRGTPELYIICYITMNYVLVSCMKLCMRVWSHKLDTWTIAEECQWTYLPLPVDSGSICGNHWLWFCSFAWGHAGRCPAQLWTSLINPQEGCGHNWLALMADCYALTLFNWISVQY